MNPGGALTFGEDFPWLDVLTFSGVWTGAVASALCLASAIAIVPGLASGRLVELSALAFGGTLVVYDVDRLRDLKRDRARAPTRSRFVERHRAALLALVAGGAGLCLALALRQPPAAWLLCGVVLALGLLHRRLKAWVRLKIAYVTFSWLAVVVGLPIANVSAQGWRPTAAFWVTLCCGSAIAANLLVWGLAARERLHVARRLRAGRGLAALGSALPLLWGTAFWPVALIPLAELLALARFRVGERFALVVLDGAIGVGAVAAGASLAWLGT